MQSKKVDRKSTGLLLPACTLLLSTIAVSNAVHAVERGMISNDFSNLTQRFIVTYESDESKDWQNEAQVISMFAGNDVKYMRQLAVNKHHLFKLEKPVDSVKFQSMIERLGAMSGVVTVEKDSIMTIQSVPNDTRYNDQWHYFEATGGINAPSAWDNSTGSGAVVAVIDTGYVYHSDLDANMLPGYDFISDTSVANDGNGRDSDASDPGDWLSANECGFFNPPSAVSSSWHGTHVAGTIAAVSNNGAGVAGVAYNAKVVPVRVLGKCGGYLSDITDAIVWASGGSVSGVPANANPADVINMSLGGSGSCSSSYQSAINTARANGTTVVVAAGNSNADASGFSPASCNGVISVASNDRQGNRASYSNYGSSVDLAAPGGETATTSNGVLSTLNSGSQSPASESYAYYQGTSMAAPHAAGVAALMYAANSSITPDQVETAMKNTARTLPGSCSGGCGAGIVDAAAAVAAAGGGGGNQSPSASFGVSTNQLTASFTDGSSDPDGSIVSWSWNFGDGATSSAQNPSHTYGASGTYTVSLTVTDNDGASNSTSQSVDVSDGSANTGGFTEENLAASRRSWIRRTIEVPAGATSLDVDISGGSGDADLYVRFGSQPTTWYYNCRPYLYGNNETCTFTNPQAGTWHIGIRAYSAFSSVKLDAYWNK
ncbi:S8 family serine peptidase [Flocculibacter collagenilyticus]|uniref:S8 family serine peptidase n=1 Tax=Flocculibacter collagenilyticus TaxID=2744479 RepID=UPI0018F466A3|nr:S8 family serine peptidase [Flocculibacter collagenilyticus]